MLDGLDADDAHGRIAALRRVRNEELLRVGCTTWAASAARTRARRSRLTRGAGFDQESESHRDVAELALVVGGGRRTITWRVLTRDSAH